MSQRERPLEHLRAPSPADELVRVAGLARQGLAPGSAEAQTLERALQRALDCLEEVKGSPRAAGEGA